MTDKKTQLVVCGDKNFIDKNADSYILVEPYLEYTDINKVIKGKFTCLKHPFADKEHAIVADEYITDLSRRMMKAYGNAINDYAGIGFNELQWTTALCEWFRGGLNDLYYRYLKLKSLGTDGYDLEDLYAIGLTNYALEIALADSLRNIMTDFWKNAWLWSYMARNVGIKVRECKKSDLIADSFNKKRSLLRRGVGVIKHPSRIAGKIKDEFLHIKKADRDSEVLLYETLLPIEKEYEFRTRSNNKIDVINPASAKKENLKILNKYAFDPAERSRALHSCFVCGNEFEKIAHEYMILTMPVAYFEAAGEMMSKAKKIVSSWNFRKIYSSYTSMELMDYCFALARIKGAKIYGIQHSGTYGSSEFAPRTEMVFSDEWCSWGWKYDGADYVKSKIRPIVMIRLPKYEHTTVNKADKILYACNYPLYGNIGRCWDYSECINNEMRFIELLDERIRKKVYLRIDPNNLFNVKFAEQIQKKYKEIKIETRYEISFSDSARQSRFVIDDYFGSPASESLLLGVPVVMFRADRNIAPSPAYEHGIEILREIHIYNDDAKKMAEVLNAHIDEDEWLGTQRAKEGYARYLKTFTGLDHSLDDKTLNEVYETWYKEFIR